MKNAILFSVAILAVATALFFGCSSDSTSTQDTTNPSTFKQYSDNLDDVDTRAALRNSWVGTSETSALWAMSQNDQLDSTSFPQIPPEVADDLLDTGKKLGGDLIQKGLGYCIDKAFGIQSKSQKEAEETTFINQTLLGIQHQLTQVQNNLTQVYTNQTQAMSSASINNLSYISDFSNAESLIVASSTDQANFENLYPGFISAIENTTSSPKWDVNFDQLCESSNAFISTYYNDLSTDGTDDENTILAYAYDVVNELFGSNAAMPDFFINQATNAQNYINHLIGDPSAQTPIPAATGINLISNYYAAGTRVSQAAYDVANILQKSYIVMAFTLQLAVHSNCGYKKTTLLEYLGTPNVYPVNIIYSGINFDNLTSDNLSAALKQLNTNFTNLFVTQAQEDIEKIVTPFITYGSTAKSYWDTAALVNQAGLSLNGQFMQNGCFPISYVKNATVNGTINGNLDYLAAECNYNGDWTVLQLFIPTNNGAEALNNISYLSGFGLIGDVDYQEISPYLTQGGTIASAGGCSSHYDNQCTSGYDDCYVGQASMQLQPTPLPSYGSGFMKGNSTPDPTPTGTPGLNQRFTFATNYCQGSMSDHSCTNQWYVVVFTPNGHLFQGDIQWQFCENETAHDMKNTQVNLSATQITEPTNWNGSILSITDGSQVTDITFGGPSNNPAGQDGNTNPNWAEYGFGINVTSAPQPTASPYPLCSEGSPVSLLPIYSYTDSSVETGTVTDATTITDSNNETLSFENGYTQFTYKKSTWSRSTSSTTPPDGAESMQGVWQTGTGINTQYLNIYCTN